MILTVRQASVGGRTRVSRNALVGVGIGDDQTPRRLQPRAARVTEIAVAPIADRSRGGLVTPYDPRYISLRPTDLDPLIDRLVEAVDLSGIDVVLAISESGVVPAYAVASRVDLPLVVATDAEAELPQAIAFEVRDAGGWVRSRRIYPLSDGDRVLVVEHHTVTGASILGCVAALRAEGITCTQAATILAVDDPWLFARLRASEVELHAAALVPRAVTRLLYRHREPPD